MINILLKQKNTDETIEVKEESKNIQIGDDHYEVIDQAGSLEDSGAVVLNCIPVKPEGREKFEARFLNRPKKIENEEGFKAIRVSRPLDGDTYIVLTQWTSEEAFRNWQDSEAYSHAHQKRGTDKGLDRDESVLKSKPYHEVYDVSEEMI
ncbi:antibiotic biosynthesis monooxygenase family protein [Salinicoccus kekensis]|uniref:Signal transduction protein TRAP n=1 Tax=Salinicoccus kekensis TaxID=714307 RepID=A0A285UHC9_9STAP|nr:antibiotic biosynthesis monooxygenase [Salinicoccus kekensis]SOC41173.1 heme-degrading monooxygenase HmoA [Salinicoccus kekensis]